jgi:hypothetical protein
LLLLMLLLPMQLVHLGPPSHSLHLLLLLLLLLTCWL